MTSNEKHCPEIDDNPQEEPISCVVAASSEHFTYKTEAKRPWSPKKVLELLEQVYQGYEKLMGSGLDTIIEVRDIVCEPNNHSARTEIKIQVHSAEEFTIESKIICEFPPNYGYIQQEQDLAYHFFAHELFHCWIGGAVANLYEPIVEAITQYMTDLTLVRLGWCSEDLLIHGRVNWQEIIETANLPHTLIAGYKLIFDKMHTNEPERLFAFCRNLADCFRQQRTCMEIEISPVLERYLGVT